MVLSTRESTVDLYIVVLDVAADAVRALLFDSEARRVEGFSAQLPRRVDGAASHCLDEMQHLTSEARYKVAAIVGCAEEPVFKGASWFPALPDGAGAILGSGGVSRERFVVVMSDGVSLLGTVVEGPAPEIPPELICAPIDDKRFLLAGLVPEAAGVYASVRKAAGKGGLERFIETAPEDAPHLKEVDAVGLKFRSIYDSLSRVAGTPSERVACGSVLLRSGALAQRMAEALGAPLTLCTEPEPTGRGAALWALEKIGAIADLRQLAASTGAVYQLAMSNKGEE
jgi:sugar (pentulose or hexulose) kinase